MGDDWRQYGALETCCSCDVDILCMLCIMALEDKSVSECTVVTAYREVYDIV